MFNTITYTDDKPDYVLDFTRTKQPTQYINDCLKLDPNFEGLHPTFVDMIGKSTIEKVNSFSKEELKFISKIISPFEKRLDLWDEKIGEWELNDKIESDIPEDYRKDIIFFVKKTSENRELYGNLMIKHGKSMHRDYLYLGCSFAAPFNAKRNKIYFSGNKEAYDQNYYKLENQEDYVKYYKGAVIQFLKDQGAVCFVGVPNISNPFKKQSRLAWLDGQTADRGL